MNTCDKVLTLQYLYLVENLEDGIEKGKPEMTTPCSVVHCFFLYSNYSVRVYEKYVHACKSHFAKKLNAYRDTTKVCHSRNTVVIGRRHFDITIE